jgi:hypothetical protein
MITVEDVLKSKAYVKGGVAFSTPEQYLGDFVNKADKLGAKLSARVDNKVVNANDDESLNEAFGRVLIEAKLGDERDGLSGTVGVLYSVDSMKPVVKTYYGDLVSACTNLCVFRAEDVFTGSILDGGDMDNFSRSYEEYLRHYFDKFEEYDKIVAQLKVSPIANKDVNTYMGNLLRYSVSVQGQYLGTNPIIGAAKSLFRSGTPYYIGKEDTTKWNVYNSITEMLKKSSIADQATKTLLLSKFFLN